MVGGVSGSAILALIFAPAAFVLLVRSQSKAKRLMAAVRRFDEAGGQQLQSTS